MDYVTSPLNLRYGMCMLYAGEIKPIVMCCVFALTGLFSAPLYSQDNQGATNDENSNGETVPFEEQMPEPVFRSLNQDSLLDVTTKLPDFLKKKNTEAGSYSDSLGHYMLRYYQHNLPDIPSSFMDIIRNPEYEAMGYSLSFQDTMIIDPLFLPVVFDGKVLPDKLSFPQFTNPFEKDCIESLQLKAPDVFQKELLNVKLRKQAQAYLIYHHPELVRYVKSELPKEDVTVEPMQVNVFKDLFQVENNPEFGKETGPDKFDPGRKYWFFSGENRLQFAENFISKNWPKGGVGSISIYSDQIFWTKYKKDRMEFNNELRWRLNLYTTLPSDSVIKIGDDQIRNYSDFGIKAFSKWSYSTNLEIKTPILNNYDAKSKIKSSALFAPLYINMGIAGMKYNLDKKLKGNKFKKVVINADISPLSFQYVTVVNGGVDPIRYGILEGKSSKLDFGSSVNANFNIVFSRNVSLTSRFKYFTTYRATVIELENDLNMTINRYFSTRIYFYPRFDDSNPKFWDEDLKYFQINQLLSFGINYKW